MAEENEQMEVQPPANKVPSSKNPLLTILVLLNTIAMGGIAYFQFMGHEKLAKFESVQDIVKGQEGGEVSAEAEAGQLDGQAVTKGGKPFPLEGFTANLAQGDGPRRFVRLTTVLMISDDSSQEEFNRRKPQIRDSIITTLNGKRPEDLLNVEGKNFLKEEIKAAINAFLVDGRVIDVFYTSFQIN